MGRGRNTDGAGPAAAACCCCITLISLILLGMSFDVVKPTEFGIVQNGWTGMVYGKTVYGPGRHFVWLRNFFITFPATQVSLEFSRADSAGAQPVPARTGRDMSDPDSGGQPVTLSFSFQYQFQKDDITHVYREFGEQYEPRFILFARMAVSDVAQKYTPNKFWTERPKIAQDMYHTLRKSLRYNGHCDVTGFQLLQVDFPDKYEDMITDIQLQVQYKLTSEYRQQVMNVVKDIDVLQAKTSAEIASVTAAAQATSALIVNEATTEGFISQQDAKAQSYAELKQALGLSKREILEYIKIRSLTSPDRANGKSVVGTSAPSLVYE